ncbi:MAG: TolC family protein, partial [Flavobacteriales bacterium]
MKRQFIITCWIALLPLLSQSQSYQFSLAEAQAYAVENSYTMQYALMDQATAEKDVKLTAAIGLPQVNASLDYNNYIDIPTQVAPADAFGFPAYLTTFLANVSQETGVEINAPEVDPDAVSELQFGAPQTMTAGVNASQL